VETWECACVDGEELGKRKFKVQKREEIADA
jgi:hypothetical protein